MRLSSCSSVPGHTSVVGDVVVTRIKGMFSEMPGTEWTVADAARLAGLERSVCLDTLNSLEQVGFLSRRPNGAYVRCRVQARNGGAVRADGISATLTA